MIPPELNKAVVKTWDDADRVALVALLDRAVEDQARDQTPPDAKQGEWLHGSLGFTEPDQHGWVVPAMPKLWTPRALLFWRSAINTGEFIHRGMAEHPGHALTPWPEVERAVADYLALFPWLIDGPSSKILVEEAAFSDDDLQP